MVSYNLVFNNDFDDRLAKCLIIKESGSCEPSRFKLSISGDPGNISLKQLNLLLWAGERTGRRSDSGVGVGILKGKELCSTVTTSLKKGW